jgi:hypothetical protein
MANSSRVGFTALSLSSRRNLVTPRHARRRLRWRIGLETPNQHARVVTHRIKGRRFDPCAKGQSAGVRHVDLEVARVSRGVGDEPSLSEAAPREVLGEPLVGGSDWPLRGQAAPRRSFLALR